MRRRTGTRISLPNSSCPGLTRSSIETKRRAKVLISSNREDVPFDLKHIRVIYYDVSDPFWGQKLIDKVAENIVSALNNPEEAGFKRAWESTWLEVEYVDQ